VELQNNVKGAVLVAGGGIAGIQASLDLADSGFLVYLVEKKSAIGGVMAQLDKTFPTNDCSMCIISPKLVEAGRHLNIELLTLSEIAKIEGKAGDFKVTVRQMPRFVDIDKCTACGECAKVCPVEIANLFDQSLRDRHAAYKLYPQAMPGAYAISKKGSAPCRVACPAHVSAQGFIALIKEGKYREAVELFKKDHPFPGVCGRVCHHPCEGSCTRNDVDTTLSIMNLHRFIADKDMNGNRYVPAKKPDRNEKVAIIGAGPAGLTCAYFLAIEGYQVTVFEKLPVLGGMLTVGIPSYRLPRDIIEAEIQTIKDLGVQFKTGIEIGKDITIGQLRQQGYKAFFIGIGAHECKALGIDGEDFDGVVPGVEFLREVNLGRKIHLGDRVAVIGGGNVAMDAVRTALRTGSKKPFVIYRRSYNEMPANKEEIEECAEEGIEIMTLTNPTRVIEKDGRVCAIECIKMELGEPDAGGRRRPQPIEGSEFVIEIDALVPAIGQESDWACLTEECVCTLSDWGTMKVDKVTLQTGDPDIFAGGDAVTGPATVVEAIQAGKEAAMSIDRFIQGKDLKEGRPQEWESVKDVDIENIEKIPRAKMPVLEVNERVGNFLEVQLGYSEEQAHKEADRCLSCGVCCECYQCVHACLAEAIDHDQEPVTKTLQVGAIILAGGFQAFDPGKYTNYNYSEHPNVVTSLELERLLSASGPFEGHLVRPSDHKEPDKIAWLQCVGSRDINKVEHGYCSGVCCMYAGKQAVIAKEHSEKPLDTAIFFMDLRTYGKDFDKYCIRAEKEHNVRFVRARIHTVDPLPDGSLRLRYVMEDGKVIDEIFDMVVLSIGLAPLDGIEDMSSRLGLEINQHKFIKTTDLAPVTTSRDGIFVCGAMQSPKDIPQSVMEASAAASEVARLLTHARGTLTREKKLPPEIDISGQAPRIGVFVCNCGINIGGVADVPAVRDYAARLPFVVHVEDNLFTCSQDSQDHMKEIIKEKGINRVVVASCSPRTHEPLFQETIRDVGLNKFLFEMANIRDQNTWVHMNNPEVATAKAKDLVRMAIAKAAYIEPLHEVSLKVKKAGLVVGGGAAGMEAALAIAEQGCRVYLVERTNNLGGGARKLNRTWQGEDIREYLAVLTEKVTTHENIRVFLNTEPIETTGIIGNFSTTLMTGVERITEVTVEHGATLIATGGKEYKPKEFHYGDHPGIMTHLELDEAVKLESRLVKNADTVAFIQCVGSRNEEHPYCSRVCCTHSLKSAITLKKERPGRTVFVLYRDIRSYGFREDLYKEARSLGIIFIRFDQQAQPIVDIIDTTLSITVKDHVLQRPLEISTDLLVLASAILPNENRDLYELFKVPVNADGFLVEAHAKLRPVDFASEGIFMAGLAHYPKSLDESIAQARAAASRAMTILAKDAITIGGVVAAVIDPDHCATCLVCVRSCPYGIPRIKDRHAHIEPAECHGCGVCAAECPAKVITLQHFTDTQLLAKSHAYFYEKIADVCEPAA
jgi:heterodisulfide reductase subunit A-like polyferredoxin